MRIDHGPHSVQGKSSYGNGHNTVDDIPFGSHKNVSVSPAHQGARNKKTVDAAAHIYSSSRNPPTKQGSIPAPAIYHPI
jgi:hypothetical protein